MLSPLVETLALLNLVDPLLTDVLAELDDPIVAQKVRRVRKDITDKCQSNIAGQQHAALIWTNRLYAVLTVADSALRFPGGKEIVTMQLVTMANLIRVQSSLV